MPLDDVAITPAQQRALRRFAGWAWQHRVAVAACVVACGSWTGRVLAAFGHSPATVERSVHDSVQDARLAVFDTAYIRSLADRRELRETNERIDRRLGELTLIGCRGLAAAEREIVAVCASPRTDLHPAAFSPLLRHTASALEVTP